MKRTFWHQFSSNHSSGFTVVGEFATHGEAEHAAETIRAILQKIADWHRENPDGMGDAWNTGDWWETPSPPEKEIAEQYQVEWEGAIDWINNVNVEIVEDRYVFMTPIHRPEKAGGPFPALMERLGGKGYHDGDIYGDTVALLVYNLTCDAPDEAAAQTFYEKNFSDDRLVRCEGRQLRLKRWKMNEAPLTDVLDELRELGCTNIEFTLTQFPYGAVEDLYGEEDVDWMLDVMQHAHDASARREAMQTLGAIGDARVIDPLIAALTDLNVRWAAVSAFVRWVD